MKWLISAVRSQVFYFAAGFFALAGLCELFLGQTVKWIPVWAHVLMVIGGVAGMAISLLADRHAARKAKPD